MYCKNCGNKLNDNDKFCQKCGTNQETQSVQTNNVKSSNNKTIIIIGIILTIIGVVLTLGTFFFFGPFFGCPILLIGSILFFSGILYKLKKIIKLIISILISIIICIIVIIISINIWTPNYVSKEDTLKYLNENYSLTDLTLIETRKSSYWYENDCTYYFTSKELNGKEFVVKTEFDANGEMVFKDNYIAIKYEDRLEKQYSIYFDKIIKQNFDMSVSVEDVYNIPLITYEEYIKLLNDKELDINLEPNIKLDENNKYFHLKTTDSSNTMEVLKIAENEIKNFINSNFNIEQLKEEVKSIINLNGLNNVSSVDFYLNDCNEDEYVISCSEIIELYNK